VPRVPGGRLGQVVRHGRGCADQHLRRAPQPEPAAAAVRDGHRDDRGRAGHRRGADVAAEQAPLRRRPQPVRAGQCQRGVPRRRPALRADRGGGAARRRARPRPGLRPGYRLVAGRGPRAVAHSLRYLANCSIMFTELPLLQRPAAARSAGFEAVEFWWPFDRPVPGDAAVDEFVAAIADAGVALVALNFFAGDLAGPDRGVLSIPDRSRQFTDNIEVTVEIGARLGVRGFNALYGNRVAGLPPGQQDELAVANIAAAAAAA